MNDVSSRSQKINSTDCKAIPSLIVTSERPFTSDPSAQDTSTFYSKGVFSKNIILTHHQGVAHSIWILKLAY